MHQYIRLRWVLLVYQTAVQTLELKNQLLEQVDVMFPVPDGR